MSGGKFNYSQYQIGGIADTIEDHLKAPFVCNYSPKTIYCLKQTVSLLRQVQIMANCADWLLSGDDDEHAYHKRLSDDLMGELNNDT